MEWTPTLLEYRNKISTELRTWMDRDIPMTIPRGTRKKVLKRKLDSKIKYVVSKYERRFNTEEFEFIKQDITKNFKWIVDNLPHNDLENRNIKLIFVESKKKTNE